MITKYYNASNHFSAPIIKEPRHKPEPVIPQRAEPEPPVPVPREPSAPPPVQKKKGGLLDGLFDHMEKDDLILLGLLFLLISDGDDPVLTLMVGYLFLAGL